ncbi:PREDICTED: uncharacterized protein LOC105110073 isoform X2 [Populus euphratica]|uniref:Uncharacterized protein LOC105110073 isoform X2 n=1 Tax=Populus euphratica TaxID=75702 RepID=A0AAJ6X2T8_POPEU|nr:PREDICTED: uncharacterized protein LOC105110073 isoform X2 [Populus euphratica]
MEVKEENETIKSAVIEITSSLSPDGTPIRPIFCLNKTNTENISKFDEIEDCFILDFDPSHIDTSLHRISTLSVSSFTDDDGGVDDLSVVAEKGQCYCYVCDCATPCKDWKGSKSPHCNASEKVGDWKEQRRLKRKEEIKLPKS